MNTSICPGLGWPYFPPRPKFGIPLTASSLRGYIEHYINEYVFQPKLNGDRGEVYTTKGKVHVYNRYAKEYSFKVKNIKKFVSYNDTLFDGEVYAGNFYPFECVVYKGTSLLKAGPEDRIAKAKEFCAKQGVDWLFETPTEAWLRKTLGKSLQWEGAVRKRRGSPYIPLGAADQSSQNWIKDKW